MLQTHSNKTWKMVASMFISACTHTCAQTRPPTPLSSRFWEIFPQDTHNAPHSDMRAMSASGNCCFFSSSLLLLSPIAIIPWCNWALCDANLHWGTALMRRDCSVKVDSSSRRGSFGQGERLDYGLHTWLDYVFRYPSSRSEICVRESYTRLSLVYGASL